MVDDFWAGPQDGTAPFADLTSGWTTLGLWGPRSRDILRSLTRDDRIPGALAYRNCATILAGCYAGRLLPSTR